MIKERAAQPDHGASGTGRTYGGSPDPPASLPLYPRRIPGSRRQRGRGEGLAKSQPFLYPAAGTHTGGAPGAAWRRRSPSSPIPPGSGRTGPLSAATELATPSASPRPRSPRLLALATNTKKFASGKNGLEINAHRGSARRACFPVLLHVSELPVTEMRKQQPSPASGRGSGRNL